MTLEAFYNEIGSDYKAALTRMGNSEKMLGKFVRKFTADKSMSELNASFDGGDYPTAFRMAHTLKGLCANLGLDKLQHSSAELTEALRGGVVADNAAELLAQVRADYDMTVAALAQLDE
ncbi:MAG: Hpt domain-containing protein [Ruminococcaceae bacterium]|nr:Hpt domain-containing protein [Oscillospiraceae bacterium]